MLKTIAWNDSVEKALDESKRTEKSILLDFSAAPM